MLKRHFKTSLLNIVLLSNVFLITADSSEEHGHCDVNTKTCGNNESLSNKKIIFYDVNPPEGFNLRRDVYMRFAIMLAEARETGKRLEWELVLPPWYKLYHWRADSSRSDPQPWAHFFDVNSLKSFAPVQELHEVFNRTQSKILEIDRLYVLQNYENPFEGGVFNEKWEINNENCEYDGYYWGYSNITAKEIICVKYQGKISKLWELVSLHPHDKKVMIAHGEIPLHNEYGTKTFWDCRKSMKFNKQLIDTARNFISKHLRCWDEKCNSYIAIHWRRQDFARSRYNDVPSTSGTVKQVDKLIKNNKYTTKSIFVATDASNSEFLKLKTQFEELGYKIYSYTPNVEEIINFKDGGVAIIDQIICSHALHFIGTHESTFTFRIQEEREIIGFNSKTTFTRLCPDSGKCEKPSIWTIVH